MNTADVLRLVSGALQDLEPGMEKRWAWTGGDSESLGLLDFLNAAIRAVVLQRPDATARTDVVRLVPGMRQRLPKDAQTLLEVLRNMGEDGETPGTAVSILTLDVLTGLAAFTPAGRSIECYAYDRTTNSQVFWVYPAVSESADVQVELTYSACPADITSPEAPLPVADTYAQALVHHMLASILSGDNEASSTGKAQLHISLWNSLMGIKQAVDSQWPRTRSTP